jgi:hypothetical protein
MCIRMIDILGVEERMREVREALEGGKMQYDRDLPAAGRDKIGFQTPMCQWGREVFPGLTCAVVACFAD